MRRFVPILSICLFLSPLSTFSQAGDLPEPQPYFSALIVINIDQSLAWYQEKLGFAVLNRTDNEEMGFRQINLQRGNCLIELIELPKVLAQDSILRDHPGGTRIAGFFKFGFSVTDFDAWFEHLEEAGAEFHGRIVEDPVSEKKMVIVKDPDGNRIQLFER